VKGLPNPRRRPPGERQHVGHPAQQGHRWSRSIRRQHRLELEGLSSPSDADRLPNGNTLVAENGAVREFDRQGRQCWVRVVGWAVEVNRY
jgi:hypothetical protein